MYNINSSVNLSDYEKIGPEILRKCEKEWKMALLLMQKYSKSKECRGFVYKKHTSAAHMIQLKFFYILYSLYIVCIYKKHTKVVSVSLLYRFCIVCTLFVCTKNIQKSFQLASCIAFV